jgi:hypothetical protein
MTARMNDSFQQKVRAIRRWAEEKSGTSGLLLALAYPKVLFGLTIAAVGLGYALRNWWGSPTRVLLLKLIDEHRDQEP